MKLHHYLLGLAALALFACTKDQTDIQTIQEPESISKKFNPKQASYPYTIPCSATSETTTSPYFNYNSYPISGHFNKYEWISYTYYSRPDNWHSFLEGQGSVLAKDFNIFLSDSHYYLIISSQSRSLRIDLRNNLPYPYTVICRSSCNRRVLGDIIQY